MPKKKKGLSKDEFFEEISLIASFCDKKIVESVFYAMVKVISQNLKGVGSINLPDWGEFTLKRSCPRMTTNINKGVVAHIGPRNNVKFKPDYKVKAYFNGLLR